jgi:NADPH-dependent 2,4-dienoyl-CoA reductase/sulfur reductase-like enzyme
METKTIDEIFEDEDLAEQFHVFCGKQFNEENVYFIIEYKNIAKDIKQDKSVKLLLEDLYDRYLSQGSSYELNIPAKMKEDFLKSWSDHSKSDNSNDKTLFDFFGPIYEHIEHLLKTSMLKPFFTEAHLAAAKITEESLKSRKRVIVVGGGFAGVQTAKLLDNIPHFQVVLIDKRSVFECTPLVIDALCNPSMYDSITIPLADCIKNGTFIQGKATKFTDKTVTVNGVDIPFDYLVLSTGSSYQSKFKSDDVSTSFRKKGLTYAFDRMRAAESVLIVGGGNRYFLALIRCCWH